MESYLMVTAAVLLLAVDFSLQKLYQKRMGTAFTTGLVFNVLIGLFTAVIFFFINGCRLHFSLFSILMAAAMSSLCILYSLIGFRILKTGNMAFYTLALMSGGMTIPYVYGLLFLHEDFSFLRLVGLILILVAVVSSNMAEGKIDGKLILYCAAVFILNGFVSVVSKLHQIDLTHSPVSANEFVIYAGIMKVILSGLTLLLFRAFSKDAAPEKPSSASKTVLLITIASAFVSGLSYMLQLLGASRLPASVLYPFITGGSIVLSTVAGMLFFKEKVSKKLILSVILCFVGTCLFL